MCMQAKRELLWSMRREMGLIETTDPTDIAIFVLFSDNRVIMVWYAEIDGDCTRRNEHGKEANSFACSHSIESVGKKPIAYSGNASNQLTQDHFKTRAPCSYSATR